MFKKVISCLIAGVIILSGFCFAFADSSEDLTSSELSDEELTFIEAASDDNDREIRTLSVEVVRATSSTYTIDDVYSLLISLITTQHNGMYEWKVYDTSIYNQINNNFSHYDSTSGNTYDTGAMLWTIRQTLNDIALELVPAAANSLPSIYELISSIDDTLTDIISAIPQQVDYTSALFFHNIGIAQMFDSFKTNNLNYLYSINNSVSSIVTNTSDIKYNTDNLVSNTNTIHNDLGSSGAIASSISNFDNKLNNINWSSITNISVLDMNFNNITSNILTNSFYVKFNNIPRNDSIFYTYISYSLPYSSPDLNIEIGFINTHNDFTSFDDYVYYIKNSVAGFNIYIRPLIISSHQYDNQQLCVKVNSSINATLYPSATSAGFITSSDLDYYIISDFITQNHIDSYLHYMNGILDNFKELYASDDLITAKENQQSYEDQVISDFTGSGSASAKASDASSAKNISSTVSSGLASGGSVNNSLSVFQTNSGFWGWFSQENSNYINNLSSQQRSLLSSGSDWVIDNPYQRNAEELQSILGGNR